MVDKASPWMNMGLSAASQAVQDPNDPSRDFKGIPLLDNYLYSKQDAQADYMEFDPSKAYMGYEDADNQYDRTGSENARDVFSTGLNYAKMGAMTGNPLIAAGAGIFGLAQGFAKKRINQDKAAEIEAENAKKMSLYNEQQDEFYGDRRDYGMMLAQQQELANRGMPNYTTNIYNI